MGFESIAKKILAEDHRPDGPESGAPAWDLTANSVYPANVYSIEGIRYYSTGFPSMDRAAWSMLQNLRGKPRTGRVRIYRSVEEKYAKDGIRTGDWVTIVRAYARLHGEGNVPGSYKILSKEVNARDIYTSGDSWLEWGYFPTAKPPRKPEISINNRNTEEAGA